MLPGVAVLHAFKGVFVYALTLPGDHPTSNVNKKTTRRLISRKSTNITLLQVLGKVGQAMGKLLKKKIYLFRSHFQLCFPLMINI